MKCVFVWSSNGTGKSSFEQHFIHSLSDFWQKVKRSLPPSFSGLVFLLLLAILVLFCCIHRCRSYDLIQETIPFLPSAVNGPIDLHLCNTLHSATTGVVEEHCLVSCRETFCRAKLSHPEGKVKNCAAAMINCSAERLCSQQPIDLPRPPECLF